MPLSDSEIVTKLRTNLDSINQRIATARTRSKHNQQTELVAVTKYTPLHVVKQLYALGDRLLGESRPQQLVERAQELSNAKWHLIGHLQSNKVRAVLPHVEMIHSVDSLKLLKRIHQIGEELNTHPKLLLQVNVSGEESKTGFSPDELRNQWDDVLSLKHANISGLMTMAPLTHDESKVRSTFAGLRELRNELQAISSQFDLHHLSMGMSNDFEIAIEEGATLIRVGSLLFKGCDS